MNFMFFTHFLINAHLVFFFYPFPEKETREGMRNRKFPWSGLMNDSMQWMDESLGFR